LKNFILFDNDGVLVETEKWYFEANVKALSQLNIKLHEDVYQEIMARGGTAWEVAQKQGIEEHIIDKQREKRDIYYQEFLKTKDITISGVKETLKELSKKYKMAIITTSRRVDFDLIHKNRGIVDFMDFTLCVEEYKRAKPYPDPYLAGLKKFNAKKEHTIVVEDSQRGLSSAFAAKIDCAIVKNEFTKTHDFSKAKYFIENIKDLKELLSTL
jgi:HAD superfamily hydrolase (TIGR01509 family)